MKEFLKGLVCGADGKPSLMDCGTIVLIFLFVVVTSYLVWNNFEWPHYNTFADMSIGGGGLMKAFKYGANVANGIFGKKGADENGKDGDI